MAWKSWNTFGCNISARLLHGRCKLTVPAIRSRMVASLRNVDEDLAAQVAEGLGLDLPDPLPLALEIRVKPEVTSSPALSLTALPGDAGVRTRKVADHGANGVEGGSFKSLRAALTDAGAVPRFVGTARRSSRWERRARAASSSATGGRSAASLSDIMYGGPCTVLLFDSCRSPLMTIAAFW